MTKTVKLLLQRAPGAFLIIGIVFEKPYIRPKKVKKLDSAIYQINPYPADKYLGNHYVIHRIEIYLLDTCSAIHLLNNWGWNCNR